MVMEFSCVFDVFMITIMTVFSLIFSSAENEAHKNSINGFGKLCVSFAIYTVDQNSLVKHWCELWNDNFERICTNLGKLLVNSSRKILFSWIH